MDLKNNDVPLYTQFAERFRRMILSGDLSVGDQFPAEIDLAKKYGVARITIRNAINQLVREDLLVRRRGKGTFVAEPKIERDLVNVASFTERMQSRGIRAGAICHEINELKADDNLSKKLHVSKNSKVIEVVRIRLSNNTPVALERSFLPKDLCPDIENEDLEKNSLYYLLEQKYSTKPRHSIKTLELTTGTNEEAQLLQISTGTPLFLLLATVFSEENQVMEYAKLLFLGNHFRFQVY